MSPIPLKDDLFWSSINCSVFGSWGWVILGPQRAEEKYTRWHHKIHEPKHLSIMTHDCWLQSKLSIMNWRILMYLTSGYHMISHFFKWKSKMCVVTQGTEILLDTMSSWKGTSCFLAGFPCEIEFWTEHHHPGIHHQVFPISLAESVEKEHPNLWEIYGCFRKWWYPQIIHFNRVFHYKPSILGVPLFLETPICSKESNVALFEVGIPPILP